MGNITHGMTHSVEYRTWANMKRRCSDRSKGQERKDYFDRGIKVCDHWLHSFENFYTDMGKRPSAKYTIERRNNDLGYSPDNCYWERRIPQARNKRNNKMLTHKGRRQSLAAWCEELQLPYNTVKQRLRKSHWSVEKAFTEPILTPTIYAFDGHSLTLREWSERLGVHLGGLKDRLRRGWTIEDALSVPVHR